MSSPSPKREDCTKSGMILSCYLDGRKVFRAVRVELEETPSAQTAPTPANRKRTANKRVISTPAHVRRRR